MLFLYKKKNIVQSYDHKLDRNDPLTAEQQVQWLRENRQKIEQEIDTIQTRDFQQIGVTLSEDERTALEERFSKLLERLNELEDEIKTHTVDYTDYTTNETEIKNKVQDYQKELTRFASDPNNKVRLDAVVDYVNQDEKKEKKDTINILKLPIRSVKGIFEEEIERSLLVRADEDHKFRDEVLGLRVNWQQLRTIYNTHRSQYNIDLSSDWHDDERFVQRMDELYARNGAWIDSKDLADLLIDSRKFIEGMKRRMEVKKVDSDKTASAKAKWSLINILDNFFNQDSGLLNSISNNRLVELVEKIINDNTEDKLKEELTKINDKISRKQALMTEITSLNNQIGVAGITPNRLSVLTQKVTDFQLELSTLKNQNLETQGLDLTEKIENIWSLKIYFWNFQEALAWGSDDIERTDDIKALDSMEKSIHKIINETKIDGEKSVAEVKNALSAKYGALEWKQKSFASRLLDPNFSKEDREKMDAEIKKAREEMKTTLYEKVGYGTDAEIMTKIQRQEEELVSHLQRLEIDMANDLAALRANPDDPDLIRTFHQDQRVSRLRQLHQSFGAFQNENNEHRYIQFMYAGQTNLLRNSREVAQFHSLTHARTLQNAFGNPTDDFAEAWWKKLGRNGLNVMAQLKEKNPEGIAKYLKPTLQAFGAMGYGAAKISAYYPSKRLGDLSGKTLGWMQKKVEDKNWFTGTIKRLAKFPFRLASVPAYVVLKPAEKILKGFADTIGGELTTDGVSAGHLDTFIAKMAKDEDVHNLWEAVLKLSIHGVGIPCEKLYKKRVKVAEKRDVLRKYFNGQTPERAIARLQELNISSNNRSFWHGQY